MELGGKSGKLASEEALSHFAGMQHSAIPSAELSRRAFLASLGGSCLGMILPESGRGAAPLEDRPGEEGAVLHPEPLRWSPSELTAAWLGHSTVLLDMFGTRVLTDPVFSTQVGINILGIFTIGPERVTPPALSLEELPPLDLILISHAHMDHLDLKTITRLDRRTTLVLPSGTADLVDGMGFEDVRELDWGESTECAGMRVEGIEVNHIGWRFPWEPDRSRGFEYGRSYNAYLLSKNGRHVVFAGDTAYCECFRGLGKRLGHVDLAIMPIGGYEPWEKNHATPEQTVEMSNQMGARYILPIHWLTFVAPSENLMEPILRLKKALQDEPQRIALDTLGATWVLPEGPARVVHDR